MAENADLFEKLEMSVNGTDSKLYALSKLIPQLTAQVVLFIGDVCVASFAIDLSKSDLKFNLNSKLIKNGR